MVCNLPHIHSLESARLPPLGDLDHFRGVVYPVGVEPVSFQGDNVSSGAAGCIKYRPATCGAASKIGHRFGIYRKELVIIGSELPVELLSVLHTSKVRRCDPKRQ